MEIVVLTGIQGSGKSSFYFEKFKDTHVRINLDTLRINNTEYKAKKEEDKLIEECIKNNKSIVIDNTNITIEKRKKYIDIAKANNCKIISYYINADIKTAIARNDLREGNARVPKVALYTTLKKLVIPSKDEGFDELYEIIKK